MSFRVEVTRRATREIEEQYDWLAARSQAGADRWRDGLLSAIDALAEDPARFPEAPEAEWCDYELRQLIHGQKRQVHRVLFEIRGDVVIVLRVRHSAQDLLGPDEF